MKVFAKDFFKKFRDSQVKEMGANP
jgi:hypothetical protein